MNYHTRVEYIVANGQREFDLSVSYLDRNHIKVVLNGANGPFEWVHDSRIRLTFQPAGGSVVKISRVTPIADALVTFQNGANLPQEDLNKAILQLLYKAQETDDLYYGTLDVARVRLGDQLGVVTSPDAILDELLRISEMGDDLLNRFRDALANIDLSAARIIEQALALTQQAFRTETLDTTVAAVSARTDTLQQNFANLAGLVDALANLEDGTGLATIIQNEADERIEGDTALASTLSLLGAKNGANNAFILNLNTVRVSPTESFASKLDAISASSGAYTDAKILTETTTRTTAETALSNRIDGLQATVGSTQASIISEASARASRDEALTTLITNLTSRVTGAESSITTEATTRANGDTALAQTLALLGAARNGNTAFVLDINKVEVTNGETMASRFNTLVATAGTNAQALVTTEQTARINADGAITTTLNTQGTRLGAAESAIAAEATTRANAVSAEATARQALTSRVDGHDSAILNEQTTRANAISAESQARQSLAVTVGQNSTAIQNEATARANADNAFSQQLAVLGAFRNGLSAFVLDLNKVEVGPGSTLGVRLSGIDTTMGNISSSVVTEQTARINADGALSQTLQTLQNTVGGNSASITTLQQVTNGLNARAGISLNVNGHITGWLLNNNGNSGQFAVVADNFSVTAPNGGTPVQPFLVSAGRARFNANVDIYGDLMVTGTISTPKLQNNSVTVIDSVSTVNRLYGQGAGGYYYDEETGQYIYYGGKQVALSYTINLAYPAKLICISSFTHDYVASGTPGFNYDISVNGNGLIATGGTGVRVVGSSVSGYISLPAGTHTVTTNWQGDTGSITMNSANLVIMAVYK